MCAHIHVCMCVYVCACVHVYVYVCPCLYVCLHVCMYVCIHVYLCAYICMCICVHVAMCLYVYVCVCMHVCMCVRACEMHSCMFISFLKVEHERIELLEHPLVAELLNHKRNKIAMPSILLQLVLYLTFLGFITTYVLLLPNPRGDICARSKNSS